MTNIVSCKRVDCSRCRFTPRIPGEEFTAFHGCLWRLLVWGNGVTNDGREFDPEENNPPTLADILYLAIYVNSILEVEEEESNVLPGCIPQ